MDSSQVVAIIDDDPAVRGGLESFMRSAGIAVRGFADAESFLCDALADAAPCVVTDLHMPGASGLELQSEIRRRKPETTVIVMTAFPSEAARSAALEGGAAAFMPKPVDLEQLLTMVEEVLDQAA